MAIKRPHGTHGKRIAEEHGGGEARIPYALFMDGSDITAHCPEFNLTVSDPNIRVVRSKILALIEEKVKFEWSPMLEVEVTDFKNSRKLFAHRGDRMMLQIEFTRFEVAERNGEKYYREPGSTGFVKGEKKPKGRHSYGSHGGTVEGNEYISTAIIKDTPEARAALEKLQEGMTQLSAKVMDILSQGNIEKAITGLLTSGSFLALPAPKKGK